MLRIAVVLSVLMSFWACCPITAVNPLNKPQDAILDARLTGAWKGGSSPKDVAYIHIGNGPNNTMEVVGVEHRVDGKMAQEHFSMFISSVGRRHYMNIDLKNLKMNEAKGHKGYLIVQYDLLDSNTLVVSYMDKNALAKAIADKKLSGRVTYDDAEQSAESAATAQKIKCIYITENTDRLREFIDSDAARQLFVPYITLKRLK